MTIVPVGDCHDEDPVIVVVSPGPRRGVKGVSFMAAASSKAVAVAVALWRLRRRWRKVARKSTTEIGVSHRSRTVRAVDAASQSKSSRTV